MRLAALGRSPEYQAKLGQDIEMIGEENSRQRKRYRSFWSFSQRSGGSESDKV